MSSETKYSDDREAASRPATACYRGDETDLLFEDVYDVIEGSRCGSGSSSTVVEVRRRSDGRVFACKICRTDGLTQQREINHEVEIMSMLQAHIGDYGDAGITTCVDSFTCRNDDGSSTVYLVFELMKGADLRSSLAQRGNYTEEDARIVMKQLIRALVFLHEEAGVTHRDIKLDNILLPSELNHTEVQLSDFGLSAAGTSASPSMTRRCGTPLYIAPKILPHSPVYGNKVDLWSSGVVMFMLLCGYPPFWGKTMDKLMLAISGARPNFTCPGWEFVSEDATDLVQKLLEKDPSKRLSAREALLHPWLAGL